MIDRIVLRSAPATWRSLAFSFAILLSIAPSLVGCRDKTATFSAKAEEDLPTGDVAITVYADLDAQVTIGGKTMTCGTVCRKILPRVELTAETRQLDVVITSGKHSVTRTPGLPVLAPRVKFQHPKRGATTDPTAYCTYMPFRAKEKTMFLSTVGGDLTVGASGFPGDTLTIAGKKILPATEQELTLPAKELVRYFNTRNSDRQDAFLEVTLPVEIAGPAGISKSSGTLSCPALFMLETARLEIAAGRFAAYAKSPAKPAIVVLSNQNARVVGEVATLREAQYVAVVASKIVASRHCRYVGGIDGASFDLHSYDHDIEVFESATGKSLG